MILYDLDTTERMEIIKNLYKNVFEIKDSISYKRNKYREFSDEISLNQAVLFNCCDFYEHSLLIECYTFAEQLFKNLVYQMVQKDKNANDYVNKFINKKIPNGKFSPNIKFKEIEAEIKTFFPEFHFTIASETEFVKKYDSLISARHIYAHRGLYDYDFNNFENVINILEYFIIEINSIINYKGMRVAYQQQLSELKKKSNSLMKIISNETSSTKKKKTVIEKTKEIRNICHEINKHYYNNYFCEINSEIFQYCKAIESIDLRKKNSFENILKCEQGKLNIIYQEKDKIDKNNQNIEMLY